MTNVPEQYCRDFYRGYHWNCESVYKTRTTNLDEDNYSNETYQESGGGRTEGKKLTITPPNWKEIHVIDKKLSAYMDQYAWCVDLILKKRTENFESIT